MDRRTGREKFRAVLNTDPTVYLNGSFLPLSQALIPVSDRGFTYGDGCFETVRVHKGRVAHWKRHLKRLESTLAFLGIVAPVIRQEGEGVLSELVARNGVEEAVLRVAVSRGTGSRGYSPKEATEPTIAITLHPAPALDADVLPALSLITSSVRLAPDQLSAHKTANRLPYVLARMEADRAGADDALICDPAGRVIESSCANLFWFKGETLVTPPLSTGALPGITRALIMEHWIGSGGVLEERSVVPAELAKSDGAFLTLSTYGIVNIRSIDAVSISENGRTKALFSEWMNGLDRDRS